MSQDPRPDPRIIADPKHVGAGAVPPKLPASPVDQQKPPPPPKKEK